jgi:hypothetical protein
MVTYEIVGAVFAFCLKKYPEYVELLYLMLRYSSRRKNSHHHQKKRKKLKAQPGEKLQPFS